MFNLILGAVLLVGGIIGSAGSSRVFIGAIVVGVLQLIRGVISISR